MRNGERMLSVSDLTVFVKMLQYHQKPTESQEMTRFRYYTVTLNLDFSRFDTGQLISELTNDNANELIKQLKGLSAVDFVVLLGVPPYTARCLLSNSKRFGVTPENHAAFREFLPPKSDDLGKKQNKRERIISN